MQWLQSGPVRCSPTWWPYEAGLIEKLASLLEERLSVSQGPTPRPSPPRGSKEAIGKHIGVFKDDGDMEEVLAQLAAIRKGDSAGVGG